MKKSLYFTLAAASLMGFAACDEGEYDNWSAPMSSDQQAVAEAVGFDASGVTETINYGAVEGDSIQVVNVNKLADYSATYELVFSDGTVLPIDNQGRVSAADLKAEVIALFGKAPSVRTVAATVIAYIDVDGASVKLSKAVEFPVILDSPVIESAYYLTGNFNGWDNKNTDFKLTNGGDDVYANPVFTLTFGADLIPEGTENLEFKVTPESGLGGDWSGCLCSSSEEGKFVDKNAGGNFVVAVNPDAKFYTVNFNMLEMTWSVTALNFAEFIYEIGNESGWSQNHALRSPNFDGKYQGYYYLDGEFKFKPNSDNWDGDWECVGEGKIGQGSDNCPNPGAGFYEINVDLAAMTYTLNAVNSITMVGDFNDWNQADEATHMTYDTKEGCWTINYKFEGKAKVKFAMNDSWDISWGGANGDENNYEDLTQNSGKDLVVAAGEYTVKLYLSREGTNRVVFDGEAAPVTGTGELYLTGDNYGWGSNWLPLIPVYGTEDTFWRMIYLHADEQFKFAPYAAWKEDFGFGAADVNDTMAGLCDNGGNFKVVNAGWYLLKVVNPASGKPSVTVMAPEVYLIGNTAAAGWSIAESGKFTVPATDAEPFVSPAFAANDEVRMCVTIDGADNWWKSEFIGIDGKLEYRGKGDDQQRVAVSNGQKAYVNFTTGMVEYK